MRVFDELTGIELWAIIKSLTFDINNYYSENTDGATTRK